MSCYLFDFDGVLVDSMPYFTSAMLDILNRHGVIYSDDIIKIITPLGYKGTANYYIEQFKLPYLTNDLITAMHEMLYPSYRDEIMLKSGVTKYLNQLKKEGHVLNILSASPQFMIVAALKRCGVYELFDNIWSCEDFGMTKGEPEIYLAAVKAAGGNVDDTWFFDDNLGAVKAAVQSGLYTVAVYDKTSAEYMEELKAVADKYIYVFEELLVNE